jgi:hypothetical protein
MPLADQYLVEAENGFTGMQSRSNPLELQPGFVQYAQNMRFDRGTASVRKGSKRLTTDGVVTESLFDSGVYSTTAGIEKIVMVAQTTIYIYDTSTGLTTAVAYPAGRTVTASDKVCCFQADNKFFILRGQGASRQSVASITRASTAATVTLNSHGYSNGDEITITGATQAEYNGSVIISNVTTNTFDYTVSGSPATPATGTIFAQKAKPALVWDGASTVSVVTQTVTTGTAANFPPADFGMYFQNRIIVKQARDKIAASDYFDYDTWDLAFNQFTINLGANDSIVGFQPWQEDKFLIFERNSIYYAYIDPNGYTAGAAPGVNSYIKSLTSEFGCSARRSIVNAGEYVFFLSDNGVYLLNPSLDLKLLGNTKPLSDPISDILTRINANAVSGAVGKVYNNRYYLAIPIDGATRNNAVLVYSMLNQAWESVDTYPTGMYVDNFNVALFGNAKRMYATNKEGGIFILEELSSDEYIPSGSGLLLPFVLPGTIATVFNQNPIAGQILTRRYYYQTFSAKRFSAADIDVSMLGSDSLKIVAISKNPDNSSEVFNFASSTAEDYTKRFRIGKRGYGLELEINTTAGRPTIGGLRVYATVPGRTVVSEE